MVYHREQGHTSLGGSRHTQPPMASATQCLASLARLSLTSAARPSTASIPRFLVPSVGTSQARYASGGAGGFRKREKKKKVYKAFRSYDLTDLEQYSLCDAIR